MQQNRVGKGESVTLDGQPSAFTTGL